MTRVTKNKSGMGYSAYLSYNRQRFFCVVPKTVFPFGIALKFQPKGGDKDRPTNDFAGTNDSRKEWVARFEPSEAELEVFNAIDERIKELILSDDDSLKLVTGSKKTDKDYLATFLSDKYFPIVKTSLTPDGKPSPYAAKVNCRILNQDDGFSTSFYKTSDDKNGSSIPLMVNNIPDSDDYIGNVLGKRFDGGILMSMAFWSNASGFGVTIRAIQIKCRPTALSIPKGVCMLDGMGMFDEEEDDSNQVSDPDEAKPVVFVEQKAPVSTSASKAPVSATASKAPVAPPNTPNDVEEEMEEIEEEEAVEEEEEVSPPPQLKRKVAIARRA